MIFQVKREHFRVEIRKQEVMDFLKQKRLSQEDGDFRDRMDALSNYQNGSARRWLEQIFTADLRLNSFERQIIKNYYHYAEILYQLNMISSYLEESEIQTLFTQNYYQFFMRMISNFIRSFSSQSKNLSKLIILFDYCLCIMYNCLYISACYYQEQSQNNEELKKSLEYLLQIKNIKFEDQLIEMVLGIFKQVGDYTPQSLDILIKLYTQKKYNLNQQFISVINQILRALIKRYPGESIRVIAVNQFHTNMYELLDFSQNKPINPNQFEFFSIMSNVERFYLEQVISQQQCIKILKNFEIMPQFYLYTFLANVGKEYPIFCQIILDNSSFIDFVNQGLQNMDQYSESQFILICQLLCTDTRKYSNDGIIKTLIDYFQIKSESLKCYRALLDMLLNRLFENKLRISPIINLKMKIYTRRQK
ncbi:hypothetical protein pb186bvf_017048 [Paramecium bursaria]